ncbi:hypothetical protein EVAR_37523_1 [Eumeta japonica]|uniref:Histone-lysine N-methyltransferase SETMAR n=1 Tax=Eumeta variegata TaxID=151549 RepID=A0A4C1XE03_EUMVA|nr:hypothetical protein EVAR_37523_1 [Eumeta japonica]
MRHKPRKKLQFMNCTRSIPNAVSVRVAKNWFKRLQSGNFDANVERRYGRPATDKVEAILEKVEKYRHISSYDITEELRIDHKIILTHLQKSWIYKKAQYLSPTLAYFRKKEI